MVMETIWAAAFAIFCWWSGTGAILWLDRQGGWLARWCLPAFSVLMGLSFWGVSVSMSASDSAHSYMGFACTIVMWGWHELAFLTGWLSGPRRLPLSPGAHGWHRLRESVSVVLWHELALLLNFAVLVWMQWGQPNHTALCTFALLWCMRVSAKLNLFVGIPLHGEQYLPSHLAYLATYFRCAKAGIWYLASVGTASSATCASASAILDSACLRRRSTKSAIRAAASFASASASVTEPYSARSVTFSHECSGPIPG